MTPIPPCIYLGPTIGRLRKKIDQDIVFLKLFQCTQHGVCTLSGKIDYHVCCAVGTHCQCPDYIPQTRTH